MRLSELACGSVLLLRIRSVTYLRNLLINNNCTGTFFFVFGIIFFYFSVVNIVSTIHVMFEEGRDQ